MALVELARFGNSFEAGAAQSLLSSEGVDSFMLDINMSWEGFGGVIRVRLMVDEDDWLLARRLLAEGAPPA